MTERPYTDVLRATARALADQDGRGVPRAALLELAADGRALSVLRPEAPGEPVIALVHHTPGVGALPGLTARERDVAGLIAEGLSNKLIAVRLGIAPATVKDHVHHILAKTGLPTRAAIAAAWHRG